MRWVVITVSALLVGLLAYGVAAQQDRASATGAVGAAPATKLPRLGQSGEQTLADYKGQVVLVNFWASWCKPCVEEMPELQQLQETMSKRGGTVLGIASRDNDEAAMQFLDRFSVTYPNLRDGSGDLAEKWGVYKQPESFLIDPQGNIVAHAIGAVDQAWIDKHVLPRLQQP